MIEKKTYKVTKLQISLSSWPNREHEWIIWDL